MMADMLFEVLNDGTILRMGNGGGVEQILQIAEDGYTFIPKENTGIELNSMIFDEDFSAQGGLVNYEWQLLN